MRIPSELARSRRAREAPQITVLSILSTLLRRKRLVVLAAVAGAVPLLLMIGAMRPLYVSEATLELNFSREELAASTTVSRQMAAPDPGALVNGAALRIASRANATRVAERLGLDRAAASEGRSVLSALIERLHGVFGLSGAQPTAEERAVDELMRNVKVSYKAHLYVIGVSYAARDPQEAARVANAFAIEYLRSERLKELSSQRATAQAELTAVSEKLGARHPRRLQIETRVKRIDDEIAEVSSSPPDAKSFLMSGQYLTLAEPVLTPTSQKRMAILVVGLAFILALAALIAFLVDRFPTPAYGGAWVRRLAGLDDRR
jgi:uncharacterized protein involved in exopolysaccharide biosynthesis